MRQPGSEYRSALSLEDARVELDLRERALSLVLEDPEVDRGIVALVELEVEHARKRIKVCEINGRRPLVCF